MRHWLINISLILSLFVSACNLQRESVDLEPSVLDWEGIQIAPRSNDDLCSKMSPEDIDAWENIKRDFTSGLAVGFLPEDLSTPRQIAHETYWVNSNEPLTFDWLFWYPQANEDSATLRLFVLLDERQLDNALPESGYFNDINLESGEDSSIKVKIPALGPGVHDLIVVGIPFPEGEPDVYGATIVVYRRISLVVGTASSPFRDISFLPLPAEGAIKRNDPSMALDLTLKNDGIDLWNWPDTWLQVQYQPPTYFYVLAGHEDVTNSNAPQIEELETSFFSLLFFIDYEQGEVAPGQMAIYGKVDKDTAYARIPLEIPPLPTGKHRILVLRIDTPGVPVCLLNGDPKGRILPNSVYGRLVGLEVLPAK